MITMIDNQYIQFSYMKIIAIDSQRAVFVIMIMVIYTEIEIFFTRIFISSGASLSRFMKASSLNSSNKSL
jgi:hypothetical protein